MALIKLAEGELIQNDIPAIEALADVEISNRFIKLAQQIRRLSPRSTDFLYFSTIFMHASEASLIDLKTGEYKKDKNGAAITGGYDDKWKWKCSDPTIEPYFNQNKDTFPESELKLAYKKWVGRPLCVNHVSDNVDGIRGIIIDTHYDEKLKRVVGLVACDSKTYPDLAHKIKSGYANSVSMGTAVAKAVCFVCGNAAVVEKDYCKCMQSKRGEINVGLTPIELSVVVTPADQNAKVMKIIASVNNYVDQRNSLAEEKDRNSIEKLAKLDNSISNVESQLNRLFMECSDVACRFVRSNDGHIKIIKSAQSAPSWDEFLDLAKHVDGANDYEKKDLFDKLNNLRRELNVSDLSNNPSALLSFADVMGSKNKYLHESVLQPVLEDLKSAQTTQMQPTQDHQFTMPNGPDKDLGLDASSGVTMTQNEQETGGRTSKTTNPSETDTKPDMGGTTGPELGSASDRFQFGNMASNKEIDMLMAKGGKAKIADIDENLNLLLKQTQEIETEMNKMKDSLNQNTTTQNTVALNNKAATVEAIKMNEARLKLRAAQRKALLNKRADKDEMCEECEMKMEECKCSKPNKKEAYWLGTEEPTPGKPQYKPENGGEPKIRMNDKQMYQDKSMGGPDKSFPGDETEKKKLLRAELELRALQRRAYWLGTEEPTPGKPQYKVDPLNVKLRDTEDRQMKQTKTMGGADGSFPGDETEKKKLLRAELVPGVLRTKFTKLRHADGSFNKKASYFEIFAGENKLLRATAEEIYGEELNKRIENTDKTGWDMLQSPEYGKEVMAAVRSDGFSKVAYLLKGAQAMPEMPPAMDASVPTAPGAAQVNEPLSPPMPQNEVAEPDQKVEVDPNELMSLVTTMEDTLSRLKTEVTGENEDDVKDISIDTKDENTDDAEAVGTELTASIRDLGLEIYAELDKSADELALLSDYFKKSASLSRAKKTELNKLANDAVSDGKDLLEEADTILAVAGKIPAGLKAFQDKQKGKKKDDSKDEKKDKKDDKLKKDDKKSKDKDKKDEKKKPKKAQIVEALMKIADELEGEESLKDLMDDNESEHSEDELDKEMKELGLLDDGDDAACGMCGMAMDDTHYCTASAKDELVREALASRKARREAILKSAEEKRYDVMPDTHGLGGEAHKGAEANTATQLDIKPTGDGAMIEGIDKRHEAMIDAANAVPTGKLGSAKEMEIRAALEGDFKTKKAEQDKSAFRVKLRRSYDLGLMMQEKSMIPRTKEALDMQVDEIMKFDDASFESYKRAVSNTQNVVKTASTSKNVPQMGIREDNSRPEDNGSTSDTLVDKLKNMW